jgi:hypothetical protein
LEHQYLAENFTQSGWPDTAGNADGSVSGPVKGTLNGEPVVISDGVDDRVVVDGPQNLPTQKSLTVAITFQGTDKTNVTEWLACAGSSSLFELFDTDVQDGSNGEIQLGFLDSNRNGLGVESKKNVMDGNSHLVLAVKSGDTGQDVDIYIDTVSSAANSAVQVSTGFDSSQYIPPPQMGFFCRSDNFTFDRFKALSVGRIEFFSSALTAQERQNVKSRARLL